MTSPPDKPNRRFPRFSLRTLLIVMLVLGAGFGWVVARALEQRAAVAWVREMGGSVEYDFEVDDAEGVAGAGGATVTGAELDVIG